MDRAHHAHRRLSAAQARAEPEIAQLWSDDAQLPGLADPRQVLLFLRRNRLRIALIALAVATLVVAAVFLMFDKYATTSLVLVDPHDAQITRSPAVAPGIGSDSIAIESLVQVANADTFLGRVVDRLNLTKDPEIAARGSTEAERRVATMQNLRKHLVIARRTGTYLIEVTASTHEAQKSASLANAVADMIVEDQASQRASVTDRADALLGRQIAPLRERVLKTSDAAAALKAKLGITDAGQGGTLQEKRITELNQQYVLANVALEQARSHMDQFVAAARTTADALPPSLQSPGLISLRQNYALLMRQLADKTTVLGTRHPEVQSLEAQIADVKRQIGDEVGRLASAATADYRAARERAGAAETALRQAQAESGALDRQDVQLQALEREANADRAQYDQLVSRQKQVGELRTLSSPDVRIVSPAEVPIRTNRPAMSVVLAAAGCLGLLCGVGFAFGAETMRQTLRSASEAERIAGAPVLGLLPLTHSERPKRDGLAPRREMIGWLSEFCAATMERAQANGYTFLVTSARPGEGKSTIAGNLAACLARGGDAVLLIEASPGEGVSGSRLGLIDVLKRGEGLERALVDIDANGVTLLPFGRRGRNDPAAISALMREGRLRDLMRDCWRWFDVVVIDGPPVFGAGYVGALASVADLCIVAVEWDVTDSSLVREAIDRLGADDAAIVLNKVDLARYALYDPAFQSRVPLDVPARKG